MCMPCIGKYNTDKCDHSYIPLQFMPPKILTVFNQQTCDMSDFVLCKPNEINV